jgi:hypothetical protein
MTSTSINGILSQHVYGPDEKGKLVKLPDGFEKLIDWPLKNGYSGTAYINKITKEIKFAHKGSDNPLDDPGDWIKNNLMHYLNSEMTPHQEYIVKSFHLNPTIWGLNIITGKPNEMPVWSNQLQEAEVFVKSIINSPSYKGYKFGNTGHSMGGFIATVIAAKTGTSAEVFDPNGSADYLHNLLKKGNLTEQQLSHLNANLITHISDGSFVDYTSSNDDYLGTVKHVKVKGSIIDIIQKHKMENINNAMGHNVSYPSSNEISDSKSANVFTRINELLTQVNSSLQQLNANL